MFKSMEDKPEQQYQDKSAALAKLDADEFVPQTFVSSKKPAAAATGASAAPGSILINLASQTIKVPKAEEPEAEDPLFHPNFFGNDDERMTRWVRKLLAFRQTA